MKFSVLLPTKNRLEYLKHAISSVLKQNYSNWEIIISDNFSEQDIKGYVESLNDSRIKYYRTTYSMPVTDNWNNALDKSTGDYIIMLGDDDSLLNNYFEYNLGLIEKFNQPDLIYSKAYQYVYPNVMPHSPDGYLMCWENASFFVGKTDPFILKKQDALSLVRQALNFRVLFNFNMQFGLFSRKIVNVLKEKGNFFQSPYPDYYAMTSLFIVADRIVADPKPTVVVGITPKSFGYFYFNSKEKEGVQFLDNLAISEKLNSIKKYIMPGTNMNTSWLLAMETVRLNFGEKYRLKVNYLKYRLLQLIHFFKLAIAEDKFSTEPIKSVSKHLFWWEKLVYLPAFYFYANKMFKRADRVIYVNDLANKYSHPAVSSKQVYSNCKDMSEVFEALS